MSKNIKFLGKYCNESFSEYSKIELKTIANKIGLITTRSNYKQLCNGIYTYMLKNGIETNEQLIQHIPKGPTIISETSTRKLGNHTDLDMLLDSNPDEFLRRVDYFQNLDKYSSRIQKIGENSVNGFIRKLEYIAPRQRYSIILKGNQSTDSDNLVYEYLVGQCINVFSKFFPCFSKTYSLGVFEKLSFYLKFLQNITADTTLPNPLHTYIVPLTNLTNLVENGCKYNQHVVIFTQYIPIKLNLKQFLKNISTKMSESVEKYRIKNENIHALYQLTSILHITYQLLSSFSNMFTHYDLHLENLVLVEVPDNKIINVIFHYPDGSVLNYNIEYLPILIDYGRCFINCNQLDPTKTNSKEIMKTVCSKDSIRRPENPTCNKVCGNKVGYTFSTNYDEKTDTFEPSGLNNIFIDYTRKNISHDCRLLHEILHYFSFADVSQDSFIIQRLVGDFFDRLQPMDNRFGTREVEISQYSIKEPTIGNVIMAARKLTDIISDPQFNINNDTLLNSKPLYGTLHIWTDLSRPYEFS